MAGCYTLAVDRNGPSPVFIILCDDIRGIRIVIGRYVEKEDAMERINKEKSTDMIGGANIPVEESLFELSVHYPRAGG